ncbi:hypothetical protein ACFXP3_26500 [Streptomyces sp. NPDC059096]|uniref:hypothetical protein n=1 Tax=Streptomyces sp. NPDC059096 TaxID=3346727 RepID=UPI00369A32A3
MSRKNPEDKPCRRTGLALRPAPQAPGRTLNDRVARQVFDLVRHSGVLERLPSNEHRPGPKGFPFRTVLIGLILSQYMGKSANINDAWETLFFALSPGSKALLDVPDVDLHIREDTTREEIDPVAHHQYATSKRVYRSWASMTRRLDPAPHDRRKRLSLSEAKKIRRKWNARANQDTVRNLEAIAQDLVLAPVMASCRRGDFARWPGHIAVDDTPVPVWGKEPDYHQDRASLEITAGMYVKGGTQKKSGPSGKAAASMNTGTRRGTANKRKAKSGQEKKTRAPEKREFRYAMMAAFPGHGHGDLAGAYPAVCLGMILHTPGTEPGPAALRAIQPAFERGLVKDLFCADRGITQAKPHNLHLQLLKFGLNAVKHYNDDKVDRQGEFRGMQLVGGEFYCPLMPAPLITAGATYIDSRTNEDRAHALNLIQSRKDYQTKIKEYGPAGDSADSAPPSGRTPRSPATAGPSHARPPSSTSTPPLSVPPQPCPPSPGPSGTPPSTPTSAEGRASPSRAPCWPSGGRNTPCSPLCGRRPGPDCAVRTRAATATSRSPPSTASTISSSACRTDASRRPCSMPSSSSWRTSEPPDGSSATRASSPAKPARRAPQPNPVSPPPRPWPDCFRTSRSSLRHASDTLPSRSAP